MSELFSLGTLSGKKSPELFLTLILSKKEKASTIPENDEPEANEEEKDYCTICGHVLNPRSLYCVKCGSKFSDKR